MMNKYLLASAMAILVLSGVAACKGGPRQRPVKMGPVDTGAGSLTAARKYLEGRWSLESFEVYPAGGAPVTLRGAGTLTYDGFGNLTIEIRADQASAKLLQAAGIELKDGVISSDGRTAVDMQNRTLTYVVAAQTPGTGALALNRPRHWEVQDNLLILTTRDDAGKPASVGRWRKTQ
jgi:hypothetical protein